MKVKLKIPPLAVKLPDGVEAFKAVRNFMDACRRYEETGSLSSYGTFLVGEYRRLFGTEPPNAMLCLIKAKIAYRLQYTGFKSAGKELTKRFMTNYEAAQKLEIEDFEKDSRFMMELSIKAEKDNATKQGEPTMVTVKKKVAQENAKAVAKENPKKGSVTRSWIKLMEEQPKAKRTDSAIAAEMRSLFPQKKKYTEADVVSVRSLFNRGKLAGQTKAPAVALEAVVAKK